MTNIIKELIGKTLNSVRVLRDEITFICDNGENIKCIIYKIVAKMFI